ncbi:2974_t:CDS:2 [Paraglomus occultum]|uniref:2974_t:CDS:1 n=1 Tax=Paraglomus occultum TaxID=144539 RepID=A0A9N9G5V1_9GLOM|nr:2974_t:CDS:2 [Paraglomus occultum]
MPFGKKLKTLLNSTRSKGNSASTRDHEETNDYQDDEYDQYNDSQRASDEDDEYDQYYDSQRASDEDDESYQYTVFSDNLDDNQRASDEDDEVYEIESEPTAGFRSQPREFEAFPRRYNVDDLYSLQYQDQNAFANPQNYNRSQDQNAFTNPQMHHRSQKASTIPQPIIYQSQNQKAPMFKPIVNQSQNQKVPTFTPIVNQSQNQKAPTFTPIVNQSQNQKAPTFTPIVNQSQNQKAPTFTPIVNQSQNQKAPTFTPIVNQSQNQKAPTFTPIANQSQNQKAPTFIPIVDQNQNQKAPTFTPIVNQSQNQKAFNNPGPFRDNNNVLPSDDHGIDKDEPIALAITRSLNEIASVIMRSLSDMIPRKPQSQPPPNITHANPFRNQTQDMNSSPNQTLDMNSSPNQTLDMNSPPPPYERYIYPTEKSNYFYPQPSGQPRPSTRNPPMMQNGINLMGQTPRDFKILLLGETGAGKSTIINTITNYFLRGTPDNLKIVIPTKHYKVSEGFPNRHSEAKVSDETKSQTQKCQKYAFRHPQNPAYRFIFIDTPGLSDTNGTKQDDKNISEIVNTAIRAGSLSALVVVVNGIEARMTNSVKNTLIRLANNLPDVMIDKNLLLVLTKCSKSSALFSIPSFSKEIVKPKVGSSRQDQNRNNKDIANIQQIQDALDAAQQALQVTGDQKNSFANYTKSETITLKKIVPANYHSTVCVTHLREDIICHDGCGLEFTDTSGTDYFRHCLCIGSDSICTQCGCGPESHVHNKVKMVTETKTINKVLQDMKAQFDMADQEHQRLDQDAKGYQATLANLQATADNKYKQIHKLCHDLSKVCSRFNFVDELHANIENMRQDARAMQNASMRKKAEEEIRKIEKLVNDLSARRNRK